MSQKFGIDVSHWQGSFDFARAKSKEGVKVGEQTSVFIKSIIPERMKIKLIIIDTFKYEYNPKEPEYMYQGNHIDTFLYSPENCDKTVISTF